MCVFGGPNSSHPRLSSFIFVVCVCPVLSWSKILSELNQTSVDLNLMVKWGPRHHYSCLNLIFPSDTCSPQGLTVSLCAGSWRTTHVWLRVRGLMLPQEIKPNITPPQLLFMHAAFKLIPSQSTHRSRHICLFVDLPCALELTGDKPSVLPDMRKPWSAWIGIHLETIAWVIWSSHRKAEETHRFQHSAHDSQIRSLWLYCIVKIRRRKKKVTALCYYAAVLSLLVLSDADCEKISAALLKSRTGEFDLESILFLKLRGLGKICYRLSFQKCLFYNVLIVFLIVVSLSHRNSRPWMHRWVYDFGETGPLWKQHHEFRSSGISAASYFTQFVI